MKPVLTLALCALLVSVPSAPRAQPAGETTAGYYDGRLIVMTRNLYIGADIFRVVEADPLDVLNVIQDVYDTVVYTNYEERAQTIADEVMAVQPHLIGLQEVTLLRRQSPGDILTIGNVEPNAEDVEADYLQILLDALGARGLFYTPVAVVENADVEVPLVVNLVGVDDIRLTDRDVILAREDVAVANPLARNYDARISLELSGLPIEFTRGVTAVDATVRNRSYRFVNTHLEVGGAFGSKTQALQAGELIDELAGETLPIILVGDFNSSPEDPPTQPYARLVEAGYLDLWDIRRGGEAPGYTCCQNETVDNEVSELDERIDLVFVRGSAANPRNWLPVDRVSVITLGDEAIDRTPSGFWPSDHAGVAATMAFFPELPSSRATAR